MHEALIGEEKFGEVCLEMKLTREGDGGTIILLRALVKTKSFAFASLHIRMDGWWLLPILLTDNMNCTMRLGN